MSFFSWLTTRPTIPDGLPAFMCPQSPLSLEPFTTDAAKRAILHVAETMRVLKEIAEHIEHDYPIESHQLRLYASCMKPLAVGDITADAIRETMGK